MKIRVYNNNGITKITKVCDENTEKTIFETVLNGEFAEIDIQIGRFGKLPFLKIGQTTKRSEK